jgi:CheY-like chemotaxis protein
MLMPNPYFADLPEHHRGAVLIVEDERVSRRALASLLDASGYATEAVGSAEEALRLLKSGHVPRIALVDFELPGMNGLDLIKRMEQLDPTVFPILITAVAADALRGRLGGSGRRVAYLRKPVDFDRLLDLMNGQELAH